MKQYNVTGMSCAACSAKVERAVRAVPGVTECSVNLLTNSMIVEGADDSAVIAAVSAAGYGAYPKDKSAVANKDDPELLAKREKRTLIYRLASDVYFYGARHVELPPATAYCEESFSNSAS